MKPIQLSRTVLLAALSLLAASLLLGVHPAQAVAARSADDPDPPFHAFDPEATAAFEAMIAAHRAMPALSVKSKLEIEVVEGEITSNTSESQAEFLFTHDRRGIVNLRGFTIHVGGGTIAATHEGNDESYFMMRDEGSPYYTLMAMFLDLPFPHLAIFLGEEDTEELCMQFHSRAPWIRPTAVRSEARPAASRAIPGAGADEVNQEDAPHRDVQIIELTSDFEEMELVIDPETKLIEELTLTITGGGFVREGAALVYRQTFENEIHEQPPDDDVLAFDAGERERVQEMRALLPRRQVDPRRRGVAPGGMVGREAPPFTLATLDGGAIDLEELRGQVVVLDFWASWCPPCVKGLPLLQEVQAWAIENALPVRVITVNSLEIMDPGENTPDARREAAASFWQRHRLTLPVAMDYTDETAAAYSVQSLPTTFVIRSDGIIHTMHVGVSGDYVEQLKKEIREAISALEY